LKGGRVHFIKASLQFISEDLLLCTS